MDDTSARAPLPLSRYNAKRDFKVTSEPAGTLPKARRPAKPLVFVVQKHWASRLHYDFRLELDGVMLSWAVPKGPSYDPAEKRMAVHDEDHPLSYNTFEGTIPAKQYGAGTVIVWDNGTWEPVGDPREGMTKGKLVFNLHGQKLAGLWELVRISKADDKQDQWMLFKKRDFRADKGASAIVRETASPVAAASKPPSSIKVTNPERVIDPSTGLKKVDLVRYYESIAERMLPHLKDRPVALVRAPTGVGDPALWPGHSALLGVHTPDALVSAAQMNTIEFHTWNSTDHDIDRPDRVIFDLDPGEGVTWKHLQEAAVLTRAMLTELQLESWLKTSGGKGLHVVVPLAPEVDYGDVKGWSQAVVLHMARTIPRRFVAKSGGTNRVGKIFIDYLRNGHGQTTAAAFSARSRPGLGVSMPVSWDQLIQLKGGAQWTITTAREYVSFEKLDPWQGYWANRQTLDFAMEALGYRAKQKDPAGHRRRWASPK